MTPGSIWDSPDGRVFTVIEATDDGVRGAVVPASCRTRRVVTEPLVAFGSFWVERT